MHKRFEFFDDWELKKENCDITMDETKSMRTSMKSELLSVLAANGACKKARNVKFLKKIIQIAQTNYLHEILFWEHKNLLG